MARQQVASYCHKTTTHTNSFGPKGNPKFRGETRYLDIVPNARIVSTETLEVDGQRLSVALTTTLDFELTEHGTN